MKLSNIPLPDRPRFREAHPRWTEENKHPYNGTWQSIQDAAISKNNKEAEVENRRWCSRVEAVSRPKGFKLD